MLQFHHVLVWNRPGVSVVNYEVMDLQKSDKYHRDYFLHNIFVMWEHE